MSHRTALHSQVIQVHPFTPIPLSLCAEFLSSHRNIDDSFDVQLQHILEALRGLKRFNNLAEGFLRLFELDSDDGLCQVSSNKSEDSFVQN